MKELLPEAADAKLHELWHNVGKRTFKLAMLQDNSNHLPADWLAAWHSGAYEQMTSLMDAARSASDFHTTTREARNRGVSIQRIQIVDLANLTPQAETSIQVLKTYWELANIPDGQEQIYLLPKSICDAHTISLPGTDTAVFESTERIDVIDTHYGTHTITSRDWYTYAANTPGEDDVYVRQRLDLARRITDVLPLAHRLEPYNPDNQLGTASPTSLHELFTGPSN